MFQTPRVDLQTCADEPIHIPGSIQPHGALLFFTPDGRLDGWSANVPALVPSSLQLGAPFDAIGLPDATTTLIRDCIAAGAPPSVAAVTFGGADYDCVVHTCCGRVVAEFEARNVPAAQVALFAIKAHSSIDLLRRQASIEGVLQTAVAQVRAFTGFDRVMAYRFRADDSGDVVAEARRDDLPPYLGQRYPAGDIPPQARRLYVLNSLRMIADVGYQPVRLLGAPGAAPLDMSFAVLRSVSPIHIEYLKNMGVGASMSISIVINGRLWGLIACHHMAPKQVPYAIRMAADVLAQVMASTIQGIESGQDAALVEESARVRSALVESLLAEEEPIDAIMRHAPAILAAGRAHALLSTHFGRTLVHGEIDPDAAAAIVASLPAGIHDVVVRDKLADWPERSAPGRWVGLLALPFDPPGGGWCVVLRTEQVEQVAWGGRPEEQDKVGPLGARLTPRGSFDAWYETVRGSAQPWEPAVLSNARLTLAELLRTTSTRRSQTEATRAQLLAMLGHDLRDPLHSINMAGAVLEKASGEQTLGRRIRSSTDRMQRMIGQVMDMSRIDGGLGLGMMLERIDLSELVDDLVDEARTAYPNVAVALERSGPVFVQADSARLAQVLSNLLSNARHHGDAAQAVRVRLAAHGAQAVVEVSNAGTPIPDELLPVLFNPFKRSSLRNPRNRTGMGLGLYIAQQVVREHHGEIGYRYEDGRVVFTVTLPLSGASRQ